MTKFTSSVAAAAALVSATLMDQAAADLALQGPTNFQATGLLMAVGVVAVIFVARRRRGTTDR